MVFPFIYIAFYSLSFNQYNTQNYNPEKSYITITKVLNENDFKLRTCAIYNLNGKLIFDSSAIDEHHIKWNKEGQIKWRMFSKNVSFPNQTMAIIDSDFHYIIPFSSGYQKIKNGYLTNAYYEFTKNGNTWGLMDSNLNVLCADKYVDIRKVDSLLVGFYENNKTADVDVYNLKGAFQYTINYQDLQKKLQYRPIITYTENELKAQKFANGPIVYDYGGKYGLVDSNCKFLVEPIYSHINVAGKYYLVHNRYETNTGVFIKHRYGILNQKGVFVVDMNYDNITYTDGKKYFLMEKKENPIPDIYVIEQ